MKKLFIMLCVCAMAAVPVPAGATNGDNLIAIGPEARAMGGVGIASPQDPISSVFVNPGAMGLARFCDCQEFDFAATLFMPKVEGAVIRTTGTASASSASTPFAVPAIGLSVPLGPQSPFRFGLAAYGVSGLGVDYRGTALDNPSAYNFGTAVAPLVAGEYTQLQLMKFAPALSYRIGDKFSVGASLQADYSTLDLRKGTSINYGFGVQVGAVYRLLDSVTVGITYVTPQQIKYKDVSDFDQNGTLDTLDLESPQQAGLGISYQNADLMNLLVETDLKWINWSGAEGYSDFDWNDQWVVGIGAQISPIKKLYLRAGYNYGKNPVADHSGFDGSFNPITGAPNSTRSVQGKVMPAYYYETFRIIGFPAVVQHHVTVGAGYDVTPTFGVHLGYMHAFKETMDETGTDLFGQPVTFESKLSEDSIDLGFVWKF
ncbi:MAG: outer membrane protein transport protein [Smithellaceae bacterium]|nr:outer membrane protein transport protein [Smithellaceae bacterium]